MLANRKIVYNFFNKNLLNKRSFSNQETVFIIGFGWSSYYFVKNLDKNKFKPIIIAPNSRVLNTPKLTNLLVNKNEDVQFDNKYAPIINDTVKNIDINKKEIITASNKINNVSEIFSKMLL